MGKNKVMSEDKWEEIILPEEVRDELKKVLLRRCSKNSKEYKQARKWAVYGYGLAKLRASDLEDKLMEVLKKKELLADRVAKLKTKLLKAKIDKKDANKKATKKTQKVHRSM